MTAVLASDQPHHDRAEQLKQLRRRWRRYPGRSVLIGAATPVFLPPRMTCYRIRRPGFRFPSCWPTCCPSVATGNGCGAVGRPVAAAEHGGHRDGRGGNAAIVGQPDIGLLAAAEMGADLSRLAVIPDPGADPVEVAAVLMDGMDLIVLALGGRSVPLTRARAVVARAHQKGCTLLVTDGDWQGAWIRLKARVCGYETTADMPGFGRISKVRLEVCAVGRAIRRARTG